MAEEQSLSDLAEDMALISGGVKDLSASNDRLLLECERLQVVNAALLAALKAVRGSHEHVEVLLTECSVCHYDIGWPTGSCDTPICDDCVIDTAIKLAEGRAS